MLKEFPNSIFFSQATTQLAQVTVCISLHNYQGHIVETLESVKSQTLNSLDLIIVEDQSTDQSFVTAQAWILSNKDHFSRIKLIQHEQNSGLARARNTAIHHAETEYIFVLDADNLLYPRCIERCLETLENSSDASMAYPIIEKFGEDRGIMGNVIWDKAQFVGKNHIDAMSLIRKSALLKVDGYSHLEAVGPLGWEDYELWCKFIDIDFYGILVPEILAQYRTHACSMLNSISNQEDNIKYLHREMLELHPWLELEPF